MKKFVILFALVALAVSAPVSEEDEEKKPAISILSSERNQDDNGSYKFNYEGSDGSGREETAEILNEGSDDEQIEITGSYRYIDANGDDVVVNYTAGKNGFVPVGTIIPKEITDVAEAAKDLPNHRPDNRSDNEGYEPEDRLTAPRK